MSSARSCSSRTRSLALGAVVAVALGTALCATPASASTVSSSGPRTVTRTFGFTGAEQQFTVPGDVTAVHVVAIGGHGGNGEDDAYDGGAYAALGGAGDQVAADLAVQPGQVLFVEVGGAGTMSGVGGFNGGGNGGTQVSDSGDGGGGGGASDIRTCSATATSCPDDGGSLASRLLVAAGGGGGGAGYGSGSSSTVAGAGGDATAAGGDFTGNRGTVSGGGAGTAAAGGAGGATNGSDATAPGGRGALGAGGDAGNGVNYAGADYAGAGGGGAGLYGGGAGGDNTFYGAGGGGGSDLVPSGGTATLDTTGVSSVSLSYVVPAITSIAVSALPARIPADGVATTTVTATATAAGGVPIAGAPITFSSSDAGQSFGPVVDHGDGTYTATLTSSTTVGTATVTASDTSGTASGTTSLQQTKPVAPRISAALSSRRPVNARGWYRDPVLVKFTCTPGSEPLATPCPQPVTLRGDGVHAATGSVTAADGRTASVSVKVKIDGTPPVLSVRGVRNGGVYRTARTLHCVATDATSHVASCRITTTRHRVDKHRTVVRYVATATDFAGNERVVRGSYTIV